MTQTTIYFEGPPLGRPWD